MPTISQLPRAGLVDPADLVPLSHDGSTRGISVGDLLAGTQPAILVQTSALLGRTSLGPGGPEAISVGQGLVLSGGTLSATGAESADFPVQQTFTPQDFLVLSVDGQPALLPLSALRALFSAGSNVAISAAGVISATGGGGGGSAPSIDTLDLASSVSGGDLVAVSQGGITKSVTLGTLLNGQTIDMASAAGAPNDGDGFWVAQGSSTMTRQRLGALWPWIASKLTNYLEPVVEIGTSIALDGTLHSGRVLVCSAPVTLSVAPQNMGNGCRCEVLNLSSGDVALDATIRTTSGRSVLPSGQAMTLHVVAYSGGTLVIGRVSGANASEAPGQVIGLTVSGQSATTVSLSWAAPGSGTVASYPVSYRQSGSATWLAATPVTTTQQTIGPLTASTAYEFMVSATNGSAAGPPSNVVTATTSGAQSAITAPVNLSWGTPATGTAQSYTVQYRTTGSATWAGTVSGVGTTSYTVTGLNAGQSYDWRVAAVAADGASAVSAVLVAATLANTGTVTAMSWNLVPTGPVAHGAGALGMNAHVTPASAPVQFGLSSSPTIAPTSWTAGTYVNTDLWGAYLATPATAGTWYAWVEGMDGSCPTVNPAGIIVT